MRFQNHLKNRNVSSNEPLLSLVNHCGKPKRRESLYVNTINTRMKYIFITFVTFDYLAHLAKCM